MQEDRFEFESDTHKYFLDGKPIPHPTGILAGLGITDLSMVRSELLEWKANFGVSAHEVTSKWDQGTLDVTTLNPLLLKRLEWWIKFKDDFGIEPIVIEYCSYSSKYKFGFTIDRVARITKGKYKDKIAIIDIKTGSYIRGVALQTAFYKIGWNELGTHKATLRMCVQLFDTEYKAHFYTDSSDERIALCALSVFNYKNMLK
jgi:hypothetical protein